MKDDGIGARPWQSSGLEKGVLVIGMLLLAACLDAPSGTRGPASTVEAEAVGSPLVAAAQKGSEAAVMVLGVAAEERGDYQAAIQWYLRGIERGFKAANSALAAVYEKLGDYEQAAHWFGRDLETGSTFPGPSAFHLAELILSGRVAGTPEEGANYMYYAASAGSRQAARRLAELFKTGTGLPQDDEASRLWLARAERDEAYERGALVQPPAGEAPPLPEARSDRLRDIGERISHGSLWGMVQLAGLYETGDEVPKDFAKAEYWLTKAASLGSPLAHYGLGAMIINGHRSGTQEEAAALVERAAYAFFPEAEAGFGLALMTGRGVPKDPVEGAYWMTRATLHGSAWGKYMLAKAYLHGRGVPRDEEIGRTLMEEARQAGYRPAE